VYEIWTNKLTMDKLNNPEDVNKFLLGLHFRVNEATVRQVIETLSGHAKKSHRSLYATRKKNPIAPVCGKGTVYKIKKLYDKGEFQPYLDYLSDLSNPLKGKAGSIKKIEPDMSKESPTVPPRNEEIADEHKMQQVAKAVEKEGGISPSLTTEAESVPDTVQEESRAHTTPLDNDVSESPQVKDEGTERDQKPSADTTAHPRPTIAEENKHESLPPEDAAPEPNTQANDSGPSKSTNKEQVPPSPEEKSNICPAPPDNINFAILERWGVPANRTHEILGDWFKAHTKGQHDLCNSYGQIENDLRILKFSFEETEAILKLDLKGVRNHVPKVAEDLKKHRHLKGIENLLNDLQGAVRKSLSTNKYDDILKFEGNPLFKNLPLYCPDVNDAFLDLNYNIETVQHLESDIATPKTDQTRGKSKKRELLILQKSTITLATKLQKVIGYTLKHKSYSEPQYLDCNPGA